jgi:DNA-binding FadR family transcriptional regulator
VRSVEWADEDRGVVAGIKGPVLRLRGLHGQLLDDLGVAVCTGKLAPGTTLTIDDIESEYGVSRSVVRETVRVLESMGLLTSRRRVGIVVRESSFWNLYDPQVLRWNLESPNRVQQLTELIELRAAIEPEAAALAAGGMTRPEASDLVTIAGKLWAAGYDGDDDAFLALDIQFHEFVLAHSGNRMFAQLGEVVAAVIRGRTEYGFVPNHPHNEPLQWHVDVASAIQRGDSEGARAAMLSITRRAIRETTGAVDD